MKRHGHAAKQENGAHFSPTYSTWMAMISRCKFDDRYVSREITVCDRWTCFDNFLADMGERPQGKTLDRWPDNDGNYESGNCRWADNFEQCRNRRSSVLTYDLAYGIAIDALSGETFGEIARYHGVHIDTARSVCIGKSWPDAFEAAKRDMGVVGNPQFTPHPRAAKAIRVLERLWSLGGQTDWLILYQSRCQFVVRTSGAGDVQEIWTKARGLVLGPKTQAKIRGRVEDEIKKFMAKTA